MDGNQRVVFLPWLNLEGEVSLGDMTFVPWAKVGQPDPRLSSIPDLVWSLLGHYVDAEGDPIAHATFVISNRDQPAWSFGEKLDRIWRKSLLLFLGASAKNKYDGSSSQVNWSHFQPQALEVMGPSYVFVEVRRREKSYQHAVTTDRFKVEKPIQCQGYSVARVDLDPILFT